MLKLKIACFTLTAMFAGSAVAQMPTRPDPADPKAAAPTRAYESSFKGYRPFSDPELLRWRELNDEMGRLNGHIGHVPGSVPQRGTTAPSKPPAHMGHGGQK